MITDYTGYWSLNELSGTTVNDYSGSGNNGTATGTTITVDGRIGNGRSFAGAGNYVSSFGSSISQSGSSRTVAIWIRPSNTTRGGIIGTRTAASGNGWVLTAHRTTAGNLTYFHTGGSLLELAAGLTANVWSHVMVTYDTNAGGTATLYVNGVSLGSMAAFGNDSVSSFNGVIGDEQGDFTTGFNGIIDEVKIYNRVLSGAELHQVFTFGQANFNTVIRPRPFAPGLAR